MLAVLVWDCGGCNLLILRVCLLVRLLVISCMGRRLLLLRWIRLALVGLRDGLVVVLVFIRRGWSCVLRWVLVLRRMWILIRLRGRRCIYLR